MTASATDKTFTGRIKVRFSFVALPGHVAEARALTDITLMSWGLRPLLENARLIVSELVTNAVAATPGEIVLLVPALERDAICLGVWDRSPQVPVLGTGDAPDPDRESGRGLHLVTMLSDEHGCQRLDSGGKIVWARLAF